MRLAKLQDMDKVVRDTSQEPSKARSWTRRLAPPIAMVPLVLFLTYLVASAPARPKTMHETWGLAPYSAEVVSFAVRCAEVPGPVGVCVGDDIRMRHEHAKRIVLEQDSVDEIMRKGRRATGLLYLKRLFMSSLRDAFAVGAGSWVRFGQIWPLAIVVSGLAASLLLLWVVATRAPRPYRVVMSRHWVDFGSRRVPNAELAGCHVVGHALRISLTGDRWFTTPRLDVSIREREKLAMAIRKAVLSPKERQAHALAKDELSQAKRNLLVRAEQGQG